MKARTGLLLANSLGLLLADALAMKRPNHRIDPRSETHKRAIQAKGARELQPLAGADALRATFNLSPEQRERAAWNAEVERKRAAKKARRP